MANGEMTGRVIKIMDEQTFASGFCKREFVVETADKFPQQIKLEAIKDRIKLLDGLAVGDQVAVKYNVRGREYNGNYYVSLEAWAVNSESGQQADQPTGYKDSRGADVDADSIPF